MDGGGDFIQRKVFQALPEGKRNQKLGQHKSLQNCQIPINSQDLPSPLNHTGGVHNTLVTRMRDLNLHTAIASTSLYMIHWSVKVANAWPYICWSLLTYLHHSMLYIGLAVRAHRSCYVSSCFEFNICFVSTISSLLCVPNMSQTKIGPPTLPNTSTLINPISTCYYLKLRNAITIY